MSENRERGAGRLTFGLPVAIAAAFFVVMQSLMSGTQCGPPGHSAASHWTTASFFLIPAVGIGILLAFGAKRRWRVTTLVWSAITTTVLSGMLEVVIAFLDLAGHGCFS